MELPTDIEKVVLVAVLRVLDESLDQVASALHLGKKTVMNIEMWIGEAPLKELTAVFDEGAIKGVVGRELPNYEEVDHKVLVRAAQLSGGDILRHYRKDYLEVTLPRLCFDNLQVATYCERPGPGLARYATTMVTAEGGQALGCWAMARVRQKGKTFPLHWAGLEYTAGEFTTPKVDIHPAMPARLDIAFALPPPSVGIPGDAILSGQVTMALGTAEEKTAVSKGCFVAQPLALYNPHPLLEAYLPPGTYHIGVEVGCGNGEGATMQLELTSPASWEGLMLKVSPAH